MNDGKSRKRKSGKQEVESDNESSKIIKTHNDNGNHSDDDEFDEFFTDYDNDDDDDVNDGSGINEDDEYTAEFIDEYNVRERKEGKVNNIHAFLFGDTEDEEELKNKLDNYTEDDWSLLTQQLCETELDDNSSNQELYTTFQIFYKIFAHPFIDEHDVIKRLRSIYPRTNDMKLRKTKLQNLCMNLEAQMMQRGQMDENTEEGRSVKQMITTIAYYMKMSCENLVSTRLIQHGTDHLTKALLEDVNPMMLFRPIEMDDLTEQQQLLSYYYRIALQNKYKRDGSSIYEPKYNSKNQFVFAYDKKCEISEFVYTSLYPTSLNQYWFNCLTKKSSTSTDIIKALTYYKTEFLPDVKRNPYIQAWQNGLFVTSSNKFYYFDKQTGDCKYERNHVSALEGNITAAKYHDQVFHEDEMQQEIIDDPRQYGYLSIKMEPIYKILYSQKFTLGECRWIFALLGRMLFPIGKLDDWAVFPYFLGLAGTGKSTFLRLLASLFDSNDVGYLNNNLQKMFALEGIYDKMIYLALDIDENFALDQATFQSMVCGEEVSVIRKHQSPHCQPWKTQGGFAGNKLPPWTDNGGSLSRRLIIIEFQERVTKADPNLFKKCLNIRDRFLRVIISAYQDLCEKYSDIGIKEKIPDVFKQSETRAMMELNQLQNFIDIWCDIDPKLSSRDYSKIEDQTEDYIQTFMHFKKEYKNFCKREDLPKKNCTHGDCTNAFGRINVKLMAHHPWNLNQTNKYIVGLTLKPQTSERLQSGQQPYGCG